MTARTVMALLRLLKLGLHWYADDDDEGLVDLNFWSKIRLWPDLSPENMVRLRNPDSDDCDFENMKRRIYIPPGPNVELSRPPRMSHMFRIIRLPSPKFWTMVRTHFVTDRPGQLACGLACTMKDSDGGWTGDCPVCFAKSQIPDSPITDVTECYFNVVDRDSGCDMPRLMSVGKPLFDKLQDNLSRFDPVPNPSDPMSFFTGRDMYLQHDWSYPAFFGAAPLFEDIRSIEHCYANLFDLGRMNQFVNKSVIPQVNGWLSFAYGKPYGFKVIRTCGLCYELFASTDPARTLCDGHVF